MKIARIFLMGMYVHLILSILVPIGVIFCAYKKWNMAGIGLFLFYLLMILAVQVVGWVTVGRTVIAYKKEEDKIMEKSWKLLKFGSIPFYILNFIYSFLIWFLIIGASRGLFIFLVPIPIFITSFMIIQSGCVGICYIKYLRKESEGGKKPFGIHYILQVLPVFDVVSTIIIWKGRCH